MTMHCMSFNPWTAPCSADCPHCAQAWRSALGRLIKANRRRRKEKKNAVMYKLMGRRPWKGVDIMRHMPFIKDEFFVYTNRWRCMNSWQGQRIRMEHLREDSGFKRMSRVADEIRGERMSKEPSIIKKRAINVTPYEHGIWCSVGDSEPFVNEIVSRRWSDDGAKIWFMLDTHNFMSAMPEEEINVVVGEDSFYGAALVEDMLRRDAEIMKDRPAQPSPTCPEGLAAIELLVSQGYSVDEMGMTHLSAFLSDDGKRGREWRDADGSYFSRLAGRLVVSGSGVPGTWSTSDAQVAAMEGDVRWADEPKTLTPAEALRALADGKCVQSSRFIYKLVGKEICDYNAGRTPEWFTASYIYRSECHIVPDPSQPAEPQVEYPLLVGQAIGAMHNNRCTIESEASKRQFRVERGVTLLSRESASDEWSVRHSDFALSDAEVSAKWRIVGDK